MILAVSRKGAIAASNGIHKNIIHQLLYTNQYLIANGLRILYVVS